VDYPNRCESVCDELDLVKIGKLTFADVDYVAFPLLALAARAMAEGGGMCAVVNAADEIAVGEFLKEKIPFWRIPEVVIATYDRMSSAASARSLDEIIACDREARAKAFEYIKENIS
jgi:1-deoxy-D-xylulose-5-phosphate reductoisomerase